MIEPKNSYFIFHETEECRDEIVTACTLRFESAENRLMYSQSPRLPLNGSIQKTFIFNRQSSSEENFFLHEKN